MSRAEAILWFKKHLYYHDNDAVCTDAYKIALEELTKDDLGFHDGLELNEKVLDTIPLSGWMEQGRQLSEVMEEMEKWYSNYAMTDLLHGELFYYMTVDEFAEYLRKRGWYILEDTITVYTIGTRDK